MAIDEILEMGWTLHNKIVLFRIEEICKTEGHLVDDLGPVRFHPAHIAPAITKRVILAHVVRRTCLALEHLWHTPSSLLFRSHQGSDLCLTS